jgi:sugar lactone lactonase YvrE
LAGNGIARFDHPVGVAVDHTGAVYAADTGDCTVRKIAPDGTVSTLAGTANQCSAVDGSKSLARFSYLEAIAVDDNGIVYVADDNSIRQISQDGSVATLAGLADQAGSVDGSGNAARFYAPAGVAVDKAGVLYVADMDNSTIRRITPKGMVTTIIGAAGVEGVTLGLGGTLNLPSAAALDGSGRLYVTSENSVLRVSFGTKMNP